MKREDAIDIFLGLIVVTTLTLLVIALGAGVYHLVECVAL